ncbi:hypothetical protein HNQ77_004465 [Silvibacterium bohemicum]|uniref:Uncharacterized protein n=1 Tax=Silvibacterium bohemicum TaxID=1577686 RepID=A0A841JYS8_9BACT|nr:hypothetical protein [Silvibacterium bohemicum]MBB6146486.1 hypothetical protein [Silvibacterium bohemicum]
MPHTRQMTAEQSPQTSGSLTTRAQVGHHKSSACLAGVGVADIGWSGILD